jgi:peptidylprolyl isomerase
MDSPVTVEDTERTVVIAGTGTNVAAAGSVVRVSYTFYNGTTGDEIDTTGFGAESDDASLIMDETQYFSGLLQAVNCAVEGDRIVTVVPPADAFGEAGSADFGIGADDTMVFVMDINAVSPSKATGVAQAPEAGFPTVELAADGTPTVSIPDTDAPADLMISTLKKGDGAVVAEGDTVAIEYLGVLWATGETFDESWTTAGPITFATTDVVAGFGKALVGQTVGSQVIAIVPPAEGYGEAGQGAISGTDTMVFVIDILETAATPATPAG